MEPDRRLGPGNLRGFGPPGDVNRTRRAKRRQKASEKPGGRITAVGTVWACGRAPGGVGHRKRELPVLGSSTERPYFGPPPDGYQLIDADH